jgi:hypothetical protein
MLRPQARLSNEFIGILGPLRSAERSWRLPVPRRAAERDAERCVLLFAAAALRPGMSGSQSLAAMLFTRGAVDGAADRASLGRAARTRLERALYRAVMGARGRATAGWQRMLSELAQTQRGRAIRSCGEAALHAWLDGHSPAPRLAAVLEADRGEGGAPSRYPTRSSATG